MKKLISFIFTVTLIVGLALPLPTFAATQILTVLGEGQYQVGVYSGAGTFTHLNSDDGEATYLNFPNGSDNSSFHTYDMLVMPPGNNGINSVTLYVKARSISEDVKLKPVCRILNVDYLGSEWSFTTLNYELKSYTWTLNPSTGMAWTAAEINSAEFGFNRPASYESHVTFMYVVVDYESIGVLTVGTNAATYVTENSTILNGEVTDDGGQAIDTRGFVWDTTSRADPSPAVPPATYVIGSWTEGAGAGNYGENPFTENVTTLATGTIYYYRACATNDTGTTWEYGDEETFTTLGNPSISSVAATYIASTSARLNALVNSDGGQACDVRFAYDTAPHFCIFGAYPPANITPWVENTYLKGQTPYKDITGLTSGIPYYFCVEIRNDVTTTSGGELTFITLGPTVGKPTDFKGIPTSSTVSLIWVRGDNTTATLVRYKLGAYPTSTTDGSLVYLGAETATLHSDLLPGTTYYYMAWGKSGIYSADNATLMATTLAGSSTEGMLGAVSTPDWWFAAPDYTRMNQFPLYGLVNMVADSYQIPRSTFWFLLAMVLSISAGAGVYMMRESYKAPIAFTAEAGFMAIGTVMGLIPGWIVFAFVIFAIATLVVGTRM